MVGCLLVRYSSMLFACSRSLTTVPTSSTTGPTCKRKLCPAPTICQRSHVAYLATCELCGSKYVGMIVRQLHARALEHLRAANGRIERTAFGDHYRAVHEKKDKVTLSFKIVKQQHDNLRLHIEEALAIKTLRPDLKKRQEEMGIGFLPETTKHFSMIHFLPHLHFLPHSHPFTLLHHTLSPTLTPIHTCFTLQHTHNSPTLTFSH